MLQDLYNRQPPWNFNLITNMEERLDNAMKAEEIYWKRRSRDNWLKWGDRNTKWFHKSATMRKSRNLIRGITNDSGSWITDSDQLDQIFVSYFQNMFTSINPDEAIFNAALKEIHCKVSAEMNDKLLAPFDREEVIRAVKQMHPT